MKECDINMLFGEFGLRCTRQREVIYQVLASTKIHPTADELLNLVHGFQESNSAYQNLGQISQATIYNTVEAFCDAGIARRIPDPTGHGPTRFDATIEDHLHLRCQESGKVHDVPSELGKKILDAIPQSVLAEIESSLGFKLNHVDLELVGEFK